MNHVTQDGGHAISKTYITCYANVSCPNVCFIQKKAYNSVPSGIINSFIGDNLVLL